ncbi:MAG: ornithine cyclodeaminase [Candidatus Thermoplasmatota archaeon]|jgi:alanine dehydrogenase|nr:ornithine cyclodeaminase [Candidatus Thermoplasmatota archaeon]
MLMITEDEVRNVLDYPGTIDVLRKAFISLGEGNASTAPRIRTFGDRFVLSTMPSVISSLGVAGAKIYSATSGKASFRVIIFRTSDAEPVALLEANYLGQIRTGSLAAMASSLFVHERNVDMGIIGSGFQAESNLMAHAALFNPGTVRVYSRNHDHAVRFSARMSGKLGIEVKAEKTPDAVSLNSRIINTVTNARVPILRSEMMPEKYHLNLVGSNIMGNREVSQEVMEQSDLVCVEHLDQAMSESTEIKEYVESHGHAKMIELKEAVVKSREMPRTVFKSMGNGIEDVAAAWYVLRKMGLMS